jgi:uncharacterized protein YeaO (DUF488 family)
MSGRLARKVAIVTGRDRRGDGRVRRGAVGLPPSERGAGQAGARKRPSKSRPARSTGLDPAKSFKGPVTAGGERIVTKRVYEPAVAADGTRVLVMRYWPRGIRREKVDVWLRELAPVIPLLRSYLDGKMTWAQYRPRYRAGLKRPEAQQALAEVRRLAQRGRVTLLCGCPDPQRCHRTLLHAHLLDSAGRGTPGEPVIG